MNIKYQVLNEDYAQEYCDFIYNLDQNNKTMLFENDERKISFDRQIESIKISKQRKNFIQIVAINENNKIIGFIVIDGFNVKRMSHVSKLVIGILPEYRGLGIGSNLMERAIKFVEESKIINRIELTVLENNENAINLYKKFNFKIDGLREKSMYINDTYLNEYYMSLII
jgi:ribosomal protein S18 acetylase RimI-like enzyme